MSGSKIEQEIGYNTDWEPVIKALGGSGAGMGFGDGCKFSIGKTRYTLYGGPRNSDGRIDLCFFISEGEEKVLEITMPYAFIQSVDPRSGSVVIFGYGKDGRLTLTRMAGVVGFNIPTSLE